MKKLLALLSLSALTLTACGTETVNYEYTNEPSPEATEAWANLGEEYHFIEFGAVTSEGREYFITTDAFSGEESIPTKLFRYQEDRLMTIGEFKLSYADVEGLEDWVMPITHLIGHGTDKRGKQFFLTLVQDMSDSPGPCSQPLLLGGENGSGIRSIAKLYQDGYSEARFETFEIPEEVKAEALAKQEICLSALN